MSKSSRRRSSRSSRPTSRQARPAKPLPVPWWKRPIPVILTAGAIAAAITAVLALVQPLLPKHSPLNVARFISVDAISQVPLSEYPKRSVVFKLRSAEQRQNRGPGLVATVVRSSAPSSLRGDTTALPSPTGTATPSPTDTATPSPADTTPTSSVTVSPSAGVSAPACTASPPATASPTGTAASPDCTPSSNLTASPGATSSPTGTGSPAGGIQSLPPVGMSENDAVAYTSHVTALVQRLAPGYYVPSCGKSACAPYSIGVGCLNPRNAKAVRADVCAAREASFFNSGAYISRGSGSQGGGGSGSQGGGRPGSQGGGVSTERQPLGELISVNLELAGLQGQPVILSWSIFQNDDQSHLPASWLGNFAAFRLEGTTGDDTGTLEMWIPLPKEHGPYLVRLTLTTTGGDSLASMDSGPFD
jgi:hypothetical protein